MRAEGVAWVTGASRGIGRAIALELARRGFDVVATMRDPAAGADLAAEVGSDAPGTMSVARLDVTDPTTIVAPEGLRVLVNNAGVEREYLPVEHAPDELWQAMFATNVFGLVAVTRAAIPALRAAGGGVVANVTSSSILAPMPFYAAYRASKAAVSAIGESLLAEVAGFGIRVVEILPGPIATDMLAASDRLPEAAAHDEYRALAERALDGRRAVADMITEPAEAARITVDAILDDDAPLRVGCDPLSAGMLDAWRTQPDEQWLRSLLAGMTGTSR